MPIVKRTRSDSERALDAIDWAALGRVSDGEIEKQVAADADTAPILTDAELAAATRVLPAPSPDDIRAIRRRLGLSQEAFAVRFGFSVDTLRNYEQGHRIPTGPARVLLQVIAKEPEAVRRAIGG